MNPHCPIVYPLSQSFFPHLLGLLLQFRLLSNKLCSPLLPRWVVSRQQWSSFASSFCEAFYVLMSALPMLLWELSFSKNTHVLAEGTRSSDILICSSFLLTSLGQQSINWLNKSFMVLFPTPHLANSSKIMQSCWSFFPKNSFSPCFLLCRISMLSLGRFTFSRASTEVYLEIVLASLHHVVERAPIWES